MPQNFSGCGSAFQRNAPLPLATAVTGKNRQSQKFGHTDRPPFRDCPLRLVYCIKKLIQSQDTIKSKSHFKRPIICPALNYVQRRKTVRIYVKLCIILLCKMMHTQRWWEREARSRCVKWKGKRVVSEKRQKAQAVNSSPELPAKKTKKRISAIRMGWIRYFVGVAGCASRYINSAITEMTIAAIERAEERTTGAHNSILCSCKVSTTAFPFWVSSGI